MVARKEQPMRPHLWQPPVALSHEETAIVRRIHRAKLFVFLREQRHWLFAEAFQDELATTLYADKPKGHPPTPPAPLALATILQADSGVSDDEAIEATTMDRRWQLVLDCLECAEPPFSKATLVAVRQRLIAHDADRRLIERTLEVAQGRWRRRAEHSAPKHCAWRGTAARCGEPARSKIRTTSWDTLCRRC
jgi:transposase